VDIVDETRHFLLAIELYDDVIGGFKISLFISESLDAFEEIKERAAAAHDVTFEDIRNFAAEHGMNMAGEILDRIEERYSVYAEETGEDIVFELVVFDSKNIDSNNLMGNGVWGVNS
jgi:DNA-binding LytR/AlgR family response regulator